MQTTYRFRRWPLLAHVIQPAPRCYSANALRLSGVIWIVWAALDGYALTAPPTLGLDGGELDAKK
jgi:hypothetical protein